MKKKVLIIYCGGTIGMMHEHKKDALMPVNFTSITDQLPELKRLNCKIDYQATKVAIDSSNVQPENWEELASIIEKKYRKYDGFVILHGTDTMSYTASALSFMLKNLAKPVIFTGSQLPLGIIRTDAKRNLITAIEIAASEEPVPEVALYFASRLFRGNRTEKFTSSKFGAFHSMNYPLLGEAGVEIVYDRKVIASKPKGKFSVRYGFDNNVALIKIFPGIKPELIDSIASTPKLRAIILETFGSGNASSKKVFLDSLSRAIKKGILILNISQCSGGAVEQGKYETSAGLKKIGVISGEDMTTEAAVTKMMFLLGQGYSNKNIARAMLEPIAGEIS